MPITPETWKVLHAGLHAKGEVFVLTGPYYDPAQPARYAGSVRIPDALYKLVYDPSANKSWAYWTPNIDVDRPEMLTYQELVKRTAINFLPAKTE